ncbi:MAG: amidohydrolase family protein [Gammaproteobacteria bacterium]
MSRFFLHTGTALIVAVVLLLTTSCATPPFKRDGLAITDVTVIDAEHGARANQTVVVVGDEIVYVGNGEGMPRVSQQLDGRGRFLIPGLWDMHVHLTYDDRFTALMPAEFLRYGITSVRDTGGPLDKLLPVIEALRAPGARAPRVYFSGPLMDGQSVVYGGGDYPPLGVANATPAEAAQRVRELASLGVDFIKVYEMVSPAIFAAIVDTATELGLPIAAHVPLSMRATEAGPRVGSLEHLRNLELDCVTNAEALRAARQKRLAEEQTLNGFKLRIAIHREQRMPAIEAMDEASCARLLRALSNTIQVPTARLNTFNRFPVLERSDWPAALSLMPASVREDWGKTPAWFKPDMADRDQRFAQFNLDMIARMDRAGVPIGAGTDTPILYALPGYSLHNELEILVAAGLSERAALAAATVRPAEFFGLQNQMGLVREGMRADLVLLSADPLKDIRNTRKIQSVIARGRMVYQID